MQKVYIIIVNYCGAQDSIACLESLFKLSYINYHVILVDNSSPDNSIDIIRGWAIGKIPIERYSETLKDLVEPFVEKPISYRIFDEDDPELREKQLHKERLTIIKAKSNRGFSAGNNIGLLHARAQEDASYYWLLNNDTLVMRNTLVELVKCHGKYTNFDKKGIIGGKLLYYNEPNIIQCLGGGTYNELLGLVDQLGDRSTIKSENTLKGKKLDYISGACMLVKYEFLEEVGFLSEDYFLYYEELDWCARGRKRGWSIDYTSNAILYHKVGGTINSNQKKKRKSEVSDYHSVRSKLLYASKHNSLLVNIIIRLSLLGVIANRIIRGQFNRISVIVALSISKI